MGESAEASHQTGPVYFSPGPCPGSSGAALDSRNASCRLFRPSRTRSGVRAQILGRGRHQAGQRGDQAAGLVEVAVRTLVGVGRRQTQLLGGRAHQHDGRSRDHLDCGDLGELAAAGGSRRLGDVQEPRSCLLDWHARPSWCTPGHPSGVPLPPLATSTDAGSTVRSQASRGACSAYCAGGESRDRSASGPAICRAFLFHGTGC